MFKSRRGGPSPDEGISPVRDRSVRGKPNGGAALGTIRKPGPPHMPPDRSTTVTDKARRTWAERGGGEMSSVLESGAIALLSAQWIVEFQAGGGVLGPRQSLPPEAFLTLSEIQAVTGLNSRDRGLPIVCVSHIWATATHPDPEGHHLRKLARSLKLVLEEGGETATLAVFIDFCCIHQACRDADGQPQPNLYSWEPSLKGYPDGALGRYTSEEQLYITALGSLATMYSHAKTRVFMLSTLASEYADPERFTPSANTAPYLERGWCFCEIQWALMVKNSKLIVDLGRDTGDAKMGLFALMVKCSLKKRTVSLTPDDFDAALEKKHFAKASDRKRVATLYRAGFIERFASCSYLWYDCLGWGDEEAMGIAKVLSAGAVPRLEVLNLCGNKIGGKGATALAESLECAPLLREVDLERNRIGDKGAIALASALLSAPLLKELRLNNNKIGDEGVEAIANALPSASSLKYLYLKENAITDHGCNALAAVVPHSPTLKELHLGKNDMSDEALEKLGSVCAAAGKVLKLK